MMPNYINIRIMKAKNLKMKVICGLLALPIMLESCAVYKQESISIDTAVLTKDKVAVKTTSKTKLKFDQIEKVDSVYYGLNKVNKTFKKTALDTTKIASIHKYDKKNSTISTIVLIAFPVIIVVVIAAASWTPDFSFGGDGM